MMKNYICAFVAMFGMAINSAFAQKPKWVDNTPQELNNTYQFLEIVSRGLTIESARADAKDQLTDNSQLKEGVRVYRNTHQQTVIDKKRANGGKLQERKSDHITVDMTIDGEKFDLQANRIDEYYTRKAGVYELHTLYQVATCDNPVFDNTYLTTSYGATPVVMSIIPGLGQWYKGSKTKGICMFTGTAAAVGVALYCENERNSYEKKIKEQPKFAKDYEDKRSNFETGRNICIGVAAAVWIYNLIDAGVAKGARRVEVKRSSGSYLGILPLVSKDYAGVTLAYNF